ncbi:hypothetical protein BHE74_00007818 [Ensete ventricosum]|nr:hypothetical protein BHE74_00007818 [Ensete ventricosum]
MGVRWLRHKSRTLASLKAATQNPNVAEGSLRLAPTIASPPLVSSPPQATRRAASSPLRIAGHPPRCASLRLVPPSAPLPRAAALRSTTHLCSVVECLIGSEAMGRAKKTRKFAVMKKLVSSKTLKKYGNFTFSYRPFFQINLSEALNSFSYKEEVLNPKKKDLEKEKLPRNVYVFLNHLSPVFILEFLL